MRQILIGALLLACAACGGGNAAPTQPSAPVPAQVAGGWTGTFEATQNGGKVAAAMLFDLTQASSTVNGTYTITGFANGTVSGTVTPTDFSGTMTFNATAVNGTACTGTFAASGTAGGATMRWTSPGITSNCSNPPTAITIAIQRR